METIISTSGNVQGFGSDRYKWVSGLTKTERDAVKAGKTVLVDSGRPSGGGNGTGTTWRKVIWSSRYGYGHRVPSAEELATVGE